MSVYGNSISILEYAGNPVKNEEFKVILDDVNSLIEYFHSNIKVFVKAHEDLIGLALKIKNTPKKASELMKQIPDIQKACRDGLVENEKKYQPNGTFTWTQFNSKIRKFNNKYSEIGMANRKELAKKLTSVLTDIRKIGSEWGSEGSKWEPFDNIVPELKEIDASYTNTLGSNLYEVNKLLITECNYTIADINSVLKFLNIDGDKKLLYKIINKVFK